MSADVRVEWSHAGRVLTLSPGGEWPSHRSTGSGGDGICDHDHDHGHDHAGDCRVAAKREDKRQALVLIGQNMKTHGSRWRACLDECLLTDSEMKEWESCLAQEGAKVDMSDPFELSKWPGGCDFKIPNV